MFNALFFLILAMCVVEWFCTANRQQTYRLVTKPAPAALIILWFSLLGGWDKGLFWFGLGLVFSLVGDILLLDKARFFLFGLAAFLLAQVAYIIGFLSGVPVFRWEMLVFAVLVAAVTFFVLRRIVAGLKEEPRTQRLVGPVLVYGTLLGLNLFSALTTLLRPEWPFAAAFIASLGATFFLASDSMLAFYRFVRKIPHDMLQTIVTYHLAQICISIGVLLAVGV